MRGKRRFINIDFSDVLARYLSFSGYGSSCSCCRPLMRVLDWVQRRPSLVLHRAEDVSAKVWNSFAGDTLLRRLVDHAEGRRGKRLVGGVDFIDKYLASPVSEVLQPATTFIGAHARTDTFSGKLLSEKFPASIVYGSNPTLNTRETFHVVLNSYERFIACFSPIQTSKACRSWKSSILLSYCSGCPQRPLGF